MMIGILGCSSSLDPGAPIVIAVEEGRLEGDLARVTYEIANSSGRDLFLTACRGEVAAELVRQAGVAVAGLLHLACVANEPFEALRLPKGTTLSTELVVVDPPPGTYRLQLGFGESPNSIQERVATSEQFSLL